MKSSPKVSELPRIAARGKWTNEGFVPESIFYKLDKETVAKKMAEEKKTIARAARRISRRQKIGDDWDGAANDNYEWPMAKALLAEGNQELLKYAFRYRQIAISAESEAQLGGTAVEPELMQMDHKTWIDTKTGNLKYKGIRELTSTKYTGKEHPGAETRDRLQVKKLSTPTPKAWAGDVKVIDMIDNRRRLKALREKLGPLVETFESACLNGATLETVGRHMGVGNKIQAMGAARALIHMALICIRDELGELRKGDFLS